MLILLNLLNVYFIYFIIVSVKPRHGSAEKKSKGNTPRSNLQFSICLRTAYDKTGIVNFVNCLVILCLLRGYDNKTAISAYALPMREYLVTPVSRRD